MSGIIVKGERGSGVNISGDQDHLVNSSGVTLPSDSATCFAWHLELSNAKHMYLMRWGLTLCLVIKEFFESGTTWGKTIVRSEAPKEFIIGGSNYVILSLKQTVDLIYALPALLHTSRLKDILEVCNF